MAVREILQGDIPELRAQSHPVDAIDAELTQLVTDLSDTLTAHRGLGLAAVQIGVLKRVIVIDLGDGVRPLINPDIVTAFGDMEGYESCLSLPDHTLRIKRPQSIEVRAQDVTGKPIEMTATGMLARVICHEVDHLNGILFIDHLAEEDLFAQLLQGNLGLPDDIDWDMEAARGENDEALDGDVQLASELMADGLWKVTLGLEVLKDCGTLDEDGFDWTTLHEALQHLQDFAASIDTVDAEDQG